MPPVHSRLLLSYRYILDVVLDDIFSTVIRGGPIQFYSSNAQADRYIPCRNSQVGFFQHTAHLTNIRTYLAQVGYHAPVMLTGILSVCISTCDSSLIDDNYDITTVNTFSGYDKADQNKLPIPFIATIF